MDILYIFGIAILLIGGADSRIEDEETDKIPQQRILLRKLQNFQETKPTTWNEVLADVLVNKIRIFSFTSQDKEDVIKDDAPVLKERTILTDFFSKAFVVYKKFIYDAFVGKRKTSDNELVHVTSLPESIEEEIPKMDPEEVIRPTEVTYAKGPKSEVELVEPKYHGKITLEETTENPGKATARPSHKDNTDKISETSNPVEHHADSDIKADAAPGTQEYMNPGLEESVTNCAEGFVKSESGNCVKNVSKLILAVPNQCPTGYKQDWLGFCRMAFNF